MTSIPNTGQEPKPDVAQLSAFLTGITAGTYEFRIPRNDARRPFYGTQAMYALLPDDLDHITQYLARSGGPQAGAVYIVGNPVSPDLLGRGRGAFYPAKATVADADVLHRRLFFVDVDAERPSAINANREEIDAAMARTEDVAAWLDAEAGFGRPWFHGTSGSGGMLLYRIDLPNDDASTELLKGCLEALAAAFPADGVKIDTTVFNAARLFRVPGTVNAKSNTPQPDRPWTLVTGTFRDGDE